MIGRRVELKTRRDEEEHLDPPRRDGGAGGALIADRSCVQLVLFPGHVMSCHVGIITELLRITQSRESKQGRKILSFVMIST